MNAVSALQNGSAIGAWHELNLNILGPFYRLFFLTNHLIALEFRKTVNFNTLRLTSGFT